MKAASIVVGIALSLASTHCRAADDSPVSPGSEIAQAMLKAGVPGVSIAVIKDFGIGRLEVYGIKDALTQEPVEERTLFQAASISKSVAAMAALKLVRDDVIALDDDVNRLLKGWRVPESALTTREKVTPRRLLAHTAGTTVHGFPGYSYGDSVPSLVQVLEGARPANTAPVVVDTVPGSAYSYSGGGFCILQQALQDTVGRPFPEIMRDLVLEPLAMQDSTYEQPLPRGLSERASSGHGSNGAVIKGRHHIYPEMAAAGLWTTPGDLALFLIELQLSLRGESARVLDTELAKLMLTPVLVDGYGLGLGLVEVGGEAYFGHTGSNAGFRCRMLAHGRAGVGVVVMTNSDDGAQLASDIVELIARREQWPGYARAPSGG
jgi:CubicO group peptidase (beta-lactamase class C family)